MKILFVLTPSFNPNSGGVQMTTWKLGKYFAEKGLDVAYYSFANDGHIPCEFGTLYYSDLPCKENNIKNISQLISLLNSFKPNIVINQMPYSRPIREALFDNKKVINYILLGCLRNSIFNFKSNVKERVKEIEQKWLRILVDNSIGRAVVLSRHWYIHRRDLIRIINQHDRFILLAPPNRDELQYFVGDYKSDKVICIPNSIPHVLDHVPQKEKIILHVGRLNVKQKRSDLLLKLWERLYSELPDWEFLIVGDGPYFSNLESEIKAKRMPRVTLLGFQEPQKFYEKASIFIMPSAYEGFPNTLVEAQSFGSIPVVFDSYGALNWIVNDNIDAFRVRPFDVDTMANKIAKIAKDSNALTRVSANALVNARRFSIEQVGDIWMNLFKLMNA